MEATAKNFNDFIITEITKNLGITTDEYKQLFFEAGLKATENNSKYKSHFTRTGVFWDCFSHHVNFINLKLIVENKFYESINSEERCINDPFDYFDWITEKLELPQRTIYLINKQYRLELYETQVVKKGDLKTLKQHKRTRTSQKVINQIEVNLNTI